MRSQFTTHELWSVSQYNSNNAWLYYGNNGTLNNNNKYNSYGGRSLDYDITEYASQEDFVQMLCEFNDSWYKCRKKKRNKNTTLEFEFNYVQLMIPLVISVYNYEYVQTGSIAFLIFYPMIREVIAAHVADRVVQTWYADKLKPSLESCWFDEDSYSCRKGKGGLRAVMKFRDYLYDETCGFVKDAWIVVRDISACFMSVDTEVLERYMCEFVKMNFGEDEILRNRLLYLTRIIYRSLPQEHCVIKGNRLAWRDVEPRKSMFGKLLGLPIGNKTSQDGVLFLTTLYLSVIRSMGYKFVHYTDDTAIIIRDKEQWRRDNKVIDGFVKDNTHLQWHPKKIYFQHFSKGVRLLGYKLRYDRILPSDRVAHNFIWKSVCAAKKADGGKWTFVDTESFMQTFNSYTGILKWCDANRLKNRVFDILKSSKLANTYDFHGNNKITIKKNKTRLRYFINLNRFRKRAA